MQNISLFFALLAILSAVWNLTSTIRVYDYLRQHGQKVSFLRLRVMGPVYVGQYRDLTLKETGQVGSLYYQWLISINLLLVSVVLVIVFRLL